MIGYNIIHIILMSQLRINVKKKPVLLKEPAVSPYTGISEDSKYPPTSFQVAPTNTNSSKKTVNTQYIRSNRGFSLFS